jgi:hypothetical protein
MPTEPSDSTSIRSPSRRRGTIVRISLNPQADKKAQDNNLEAQANAEIQANFEEERSLNRVHFNVPDTPDDSKKSKLGSTRPNRGIKNTQEKSAPPSTTTPASSKNPPPTVDIVGGKPTISSPMRLQPKPVRTSATPPAPRPNCDKTVKSRLGRVRYKS